VRRAAGLFALALAACSSSSPPAGGAANDGGGVGQGNDAAASPDGASGGDDGGTAGDQCGAAPYVTLGITVTSFATSGSPSQPIPGVKFTSTLCPGTFTTSDADGKITGKVTKDAVFYGRFEASGYTTILTPELTYGADDPNVGVQLLPALFTSLIGNYDASKGTIFIGAEADNGHDGGSDPCDQLDGISFAVDGHPELKPTYYAPGSIPSAVPGTSTTSAGRASFAGIDPGEPLTITATKAGCSVTFVHAADTGRIPREAGYVTLIAAYVHDGGGSDAGAD
jgi:hypothetical protein